MSKILWGQAGDKRYETGVDRGVLYVRDNTGIYPLGVPWNGLTTVTESPSGAEPNKQYADNTVYANITSAEEYAATIEAFTYPDEFEACDGTAELAPGVAVGQQNRKTFGFSYRSLIGDDVVGMDKGYKINIVYGALAAPSEKAHATVNDSPEAAAFSWEISTTPIDVPGLKPSATLTIDSTKVSPADLAEIEDLLYGTPGTDPRLPTPAEIFALIGATTEVTATAPTATTAGVITIPNVTGVTYRRDDTKAIVTNAATVQVPGGIGSSLVITATANATYKLKNGTDDDWSFTKTV